VKAYEVGSSCCLFQKLSLRSASMTGGNAEHVCTCSRRPLLRELTSYPYNYIAFTLAVHLATFESL
jgi:hypothetical protein